MEKKTLTREESCKKLLDYANDLLLATDEEIFRQLDGYVLNLSGVVISDISDSDKGIDGTRKLKKMFDPTPGDGRTTIINFTSISLEKADLREADFSDVALVKAKLNGALMDGIRFNYNTLILAGNENRKLLIEANPKRVIADQKMLEFVTKKGITSHDELEELADAQRGSERALSGFQAMLKNQSGNGPRGNQR